MPEKKAGPKSGSKSTKSRAKTGKKKHSNNNNNNEVKLNRGTTSSSSALPTQSTYFGAKKLPSTTPESVKKSQAKSSRTSKSPVRSVSQPTTVQPAHGFPAVSRTSNSNCQKSRSSSSFSSKTNREKSRISLIKQANSASQSSVRLSSRKNATTSRQSTINIGSGDATKIKKKKQNILTAIRPCNVESERVRFMARKFDYDPRFVYINPPSEEDLERFTKPSKKLLDQAIKIIHIALKKYGTYENFAAINGGLQIPRREFTHMFKEYVTMESLEGKVVLNLGEEIVSRAVMTRSNGKPCLSVKVSTLREKWAPGLLRHELGTHLLRGMNNKQQPWHSNKARGCHNLLPANPTEEGLASIHSVLYRDDPNMWRSALLYYTTYKASLMSFSDLFRDLEKFVSDPDTRWGYCVRAKRGLVDTSEPGCFSKDQVYLTGVFELLRYRHRINFHSLVRMGKVAYQDVERLKPQAVLDPKVVKIPFFMNDLQSYKAKMHYIMTKNGLTDVDLVKLYPDVPGESWWQP